MSSTANYYRDWLGVDTPAATPSYYELLGLRPLEADTAKIGAAFQRQTQRLTPHLSGSAADAAQRLMSELAEARMTLLTPTAKRAYDQALAARYQAAPSASAGDELSIVSDPGAILPPAASGFPAPQATAPAAQSYQQPAGGPAAYGPTHAEPAVAYPAQAFPAAQGYPHARAQAYPAGTYQAWQSQGPAATAPAYPASPYYAAPQAAAGYAVAAPVAQPEAVPAVRRRTLRRRSNAVPVLTGMAAIVVVVVGGLWFYLQGSKMVAVAKPDEERDDKPRHSASPDSAIERPAAKHEDRLKPQSSPTIERAAPKSPPDPVMPARTVNKPTSEAPPVRPPQAAEPDPAQGATTKPQPDKPEAAMPESAKPESAKPEPGKPAVPPSDTQPEPAEMKAAAAERKAVDEILKSVRAALAGRDVAKARDLLAEATIEATAPDTVADVNHVEVLTGYVESFWEAVRKTMPKVELAELEIDGKVLNVVEADENHIVVRAQGTNREYRWQKLPNKLAYYLANRWLADDDPVRNLVLAAFEIAEPKGDRDNARTLLNAAAVAGLDAKPLLAELAIARGR